MLERRGREAQSFYAPTVLWLDKITDKVNLVHVMAKRTPFTEISKEIPKDTESRAFPSYFTYFKSPSICEKMDWVIAEIANIKC